MIKALGTSGDGRLLFTMGLTEGNLQRLRAGDPIHILKEQMTGLPFDIVIFYGKDDEELHDIIAPAIKDTTIIEDHTRRKKQ